MSFLLAHRIVGEPRASRYAYVLHGALGSGQNFTRFAQRLAQSRPEYAYVLVDLRNHGRSVGAPGPHTLQSCADDLARLAESLDRPAKVVLGHSFGGKVALEHARREAERGAAGTEQLWVLDAVPGAQPLGSESEVSAVIRAVRSVPVPALSRQAVVEHLVAEAGLSSGMAQWMATNLTRTQARYDWGFDLDGIEALMRDYFVRDLWPFLERPRQTPAIELVVAERSERWTAAMRQRAQSLPASSGVRYHSLADAGHWLHVDNPDALLELIRSYLV